MYVLLNGDEVLERQRKKGIPACGRDVVKAEKLPMIGINSLKHPLKEEAF